MNIFKFKRRTILINLVTFILIMTFFCQNIILANEKMENNFLSAQSLFKLFEKKGKTLREALDTEDRLFALREMVLKGELNENRLREKDRQVANREFIEKIQFSYKAQRVRGIENVYFMEGNHLYEDQYGNEQVILFYPREKIPWKLLRENYGVATNEDEDYAKRGFWIASMKSKHGKEATTPLAHVPQNNPLLTPTYAVSDSTSEIVSREVAEKIEKFKEIVNAINAVATRLDLARGRVFEFSVNLDPEDNADSGDHVSVNVNLGSILKPGDHLAFTIAHELAHLLLLHKTFPSHFYMRYRPDFETYFKERELAADKLAIMMVMALSDHSITIEGIIHGFEEYLQNHPREHYDSFMHPSTPARIAAIRDLAVQLKDLPTASLLRKAEKFIIDNSSFNIKIICLSLISREKLPFLSRSEVILIFIRKILKRIVRGIKIFDTAKIHKERASPAAKIYIPEEVFGHRLGEDQSVLSKPDKYAKGDSDGEKETIPKGTPAPSGESVKRSITEIAAISRISPMPIRNILKWLVITGGSVFILSLIPVHVLQGWISIFALVFLVVTFYLHCLNKEDFYELQPAEFKTRRRLAINVPLVTICGLVLSQFGCKTTSYVRREEKKSKIMRDKIDKKGTSDFIEPEGLLPIEKQDFIEELKRLALDIEDPQFRKYATQFVNGFIKNGILVTLPSDVMSLGSKDYVARYDPLTDQVLVNYIVWQDYLPHKILMQGAMIHEGKHIEDTRTNNKSHKKFLAILKMWDYLLNRREADNLVINPDGTWIRLSGLNFYTYQLALLTAYLHINYEVNAYIEEYRFYQNMLGNVGDYISTLELKNMWDPPRPGNPKGYDNYFLMKQLNLRHSLFNGAILADGSIEESKVRRNYFKNIFLSVPAFNYASVCILLAEHMRGTIRYSPGQEPQYIVLNPDKFLDWLDTGIFVDKNGDEINLMELDLTIPSSDPAKNGALERRDLPNYILSAIFGMLNDDRGDSDVDTQDTDAIGEGDSDGEKNGSPVMVDGKEDESDPNVTCGNISKWGHEASYKALDRQLKRQFEFLRKVLSTERSWMVLEKDLTEEQVDFAIEILCNMGKEKFERYDFKHLSYHTVLRFKGITREQLRDWREEMIARIGIPRNGDKRVNIFFSIPEDGAELFWVKDPKTEGWTYAGGHFNQAATRIHISLPVVRERGIEGGIAIADHEYNHIKSIQKGEPEKGHRKNDRGMNLVELIADFELGLIMERDDIGSSPSLLVQYALSLRAVARDLRSNSITIADIEKFYEGPFAEAYRIGTKEDEAAKTVKYYLGREGYGEYLMGEMGERIYRDLARVCFVDFSLLDKSMRRAKRYLEKGWRKQKRKDEEDRNTRLRSLIKATVEITRSDSPEKRGGQGHGVIVSFDREYVYILTNYHVIGNADVESLSIKAFVPLGSFQVIDKNQDSDLALLRAERIEVSEAPRVWFTGVPRISSGAGFLSDGFMNPFLWSEYRHPEDDRFLEKIIRTRISSGRGMELSELLCSPPGWPGCSGSPLTDCRGYFIGLIYALANYSILKNIELPSLGAIIPIETVREFLTKNNVPNILHESDWKRRHDDFVTLKSQQKRNVDRFNDAVKSEVVKAKKVILALDTDIGDMEYYAEKLLTELELSDFENIYFIRSEGKNLQGEVERKIEHLLNKRIIASSEDVDVVLVAQDYNLRIGHLGYYNKLKRPSNIHIVSVDDGNLEPENYIPILELLTFAMKLRDENEYEEVAKLYNEITGDVLTEEILRNIKKLKMPIILPKAEPMKINLIEEVYETSRELFQSA